MSTPHPGAPRTAIAVWTATVERHTSESFPCRALCRCIVQHVDNRKFAEPRALVVEALTVNGRSVLTERTLLYRLSPITSNPMRIAMNPGDLMVLRVRNVSPRALPIELRFLADAYPETPSL